MARWLRHFDRKSIHIVHGERFIEQPWKEVADVETFLGVPPAVTQDNFFFNSTKGFYCGLDRRITGVWECTKRKCLSKSKGRPKPPVDDQAIVKFRQFYDGHNKVFERMVGKEFGWTTAAEEEARLEAEREMDSG